MNHVFHDSRSGRTQLEDIPAPGGRRPSPFPFAELVGCTRAMLDAAEQIAER